MGCEIMMESLRNSPVFYGFTIGLVLGAVIVIGFLLAMYHDWKTINGKDKK